MYELMNAPINIPLDPPPYNLTIFKGYKENILSRQSASFFIRSQMAQDFLNWLYDTACPEEFFYATLARVSQDQYFYKGQISQGNSFKKYNKCLKCSFLSKIFLFYYYFRFIVIL